MNFSEIELIRFVKEFANFCLERKCMPAKSSFERIQFLYYLPHQLGVKTYKKLGLKPDKECFVVTSCYEGGDIIFITNNTDRGAICDIYETVSNYLDTL